MSYLDVSKIEVCKTLEDNYDIILEESNLTGKEIVYE